MFHGNGFIEMEREDYNYKRYIQRYYEARNAVKRTNYEIESYQSKKRSGESALVSENKKKKDLEARLADIKEIIALLENSVPAYITRANRTAETVGEKYVSAVKCSEITNADIEAAYHTESIENDVNSADTYQNCLSEKDRLETAIEDLNRAIQKLHNEIIALEDSISGAKKGLLNYEYEMQSYKKKAGL